MKNSELYNRTVNILKEAYFNDTLVVNNPCACAVGNLVAANMGKPFIRYQECGEEIIEWKEGWPSWYNSIEPIYSDRGDKEEMIASTGYSMKEIIEIEKAFESTQLNDSSKDEQMFNGLMAVIEVLDQIHENTDEHLTVQTKNKFNKTIRNPNQLCVVDFGAGVIG